MRFVRARSIVRSVGDRDQSDSVCWGRRLGDTLRPRMFRQVRFDCGACGEGFVDWHDDDWERSPVYCVHCGAQLSAGASLPPSAFEEQVASNSEARAARALGVLRSDGTGFRDTLPGLTEDLPPISSESGEARDRDTEPTLPRASRPREASNAASTAPKERLTRAPVWTARGRKLAPIAALLLGFAGGVSAGLLAENPLLRLIRPATYQRLRLSERLARVSRAIDDGQWQQARDLLDRCRVEAPAGDSRLATLRARLTLGLILANRSAEARRELSAVAQSASIRPSAADLQRVYDAWFPRAASAAGMNTSAPVPADSAANLANLSAPKAKVVTKRELLSFARDRQQRVKLDEAERLYNEILRTHPNDAEARCGLAEVQLLRGGADDGAKLFERALADNANYPPAWVGLADIDWLHGRPERAACRYQAVIDRFPAGSYPPYIVQRIAQVASSGVNPPTARADVSAANACGE